MSKLESAFSKALRERLQSTEGQDFDSNLAGAMGVATATDALTKSNGKDVRDLVSARNQIQKMRQSRSLTDEELAKKRLIYPRMKDVKLLNIYRNLRTKLLSTSTTPNFTTMITSVVTGGGSSLVSANLASTFAFDEGKTAILIDGNIQNPSLSKIFGLEPELPGLIDYLESENLKVNSIVHETGIPRLRLIASGKVRENSAEYFTSEKMKALIAEVAQRYPERFPIIDATSIRDSADARILMDMCDKIVLVIPYGLCSESDIKNAVQAAGKKLAGVVLNQF